jgi:hypothetical protein
MFTDTKEFMQQARVIAHENNRSACTEQFKRGNFWLNLQICFSVQTLVFLLLWMKYEWAQIGYHTSTLGLLAAGLGVFKYKVVRHLSLYRLSLAVYAVAYTCMVATSLWCRNCGSSAYVKLSVALIGVYVSALYATIIVNSVNYVGII